MIAGLQNGSNGCNPNASTCFKEVLTVILPPTGSDKRNLAKVPQTKVFEILTNGKYFTVEKNEFLTKITRCAHDRLQLFT